MINHQTFLRSALYIALFCSVSSGQDFNKYRDFKFGMDAESVAKQLQLKPSDVRTIYARPAVIQTIEWNPTSYSAPAAIASIRTIRFDFYNDQLFKMVITYDSTGTEGLTADDLIEAVSALYGTAAMPDESVTVSNSATYQDRERVLARWEDEQYSYNLFHVSYGIGFGLAAFSKAVDQMANNSIQEADRLDKLEAPAKELARQKKQEDDARTAKEAARSMNKPKFRP